MDTEQLRARARAVFLACEEPVAKDISKILNDAASEIDRLKAQTAPVAEVPCSAGLSDVLELLEKDLKLSQRLIDDNKVKSDVEIVRVFQIKRGHIKDLIEQVKALGREHLRSAGPEPC